jgi:hypothetical protein
MRKKQAAAYLATACFLRMTMVAFVTNSVTDITRVLLQICCKLK